MSDEIDIVVRDRIDSKIRRKITNIARASEIAEGKIQNLKRVLNFRGLNLGLKNTGIANLDTALSKVQIQYGKTAQAAANSTAAQENALNRMIALEEKAILAREKRVSASVRNAKLEQDAANRSAAVRETAQQRVRREQNKTFNQNKLALQRIQTEEQRTLKQTVLTEAAKRNELVKSDNLRKTLTERFKATQASVAASVATSNNRIVTSTNSVIVKEQALVAALDRSSVGYQKMAKAGLAAEAAQNRVTAAQTRLAGPTSVVARNTTTLSRRQVRAALSANELAISNNKAAKSAIDLQMAELRLQRSLSGTAVSSDRAAKSVHRLTTAHRVQNGIIRRSISNIRNLLAIYGGYNLLFAVSSGLDTFTQVDNRLKSITKTASDLEVVKRKLFTIADDSRVPIGELATAFQRFDKALKLTGASQQEVLDFTETLTKSLKVNGNTAQETLSVITQLSQGLTSNTLAGEELKAIRENAPIEVLQALANVMGTNIGQLKKLGSQGKLTASVIRTAFRNARAGILTDFEKLTPTISERLVQFGNKFALYLERLELRTGVFTKVGNGIAWVADNLELVEKRAIQVIASFAIFKTATGIIGFFTAGASSIGAMTAAFGPWGTAIGTASFLMTSMLALVSVGIGTLIAFRDDIKLTSDGVVTLGDAFSVWGERASLAFLAASSAARVFASEYLKVDKPSDVINNFLDILETVFVSTSLVFTDISNLVERIWYGIGDTIRIVWNDAMRSILEATKDTILGAANTINNNLNGGVFERFFGKFEIGKNLESDFDTQIEEYKKANAIIEQLDSKRRTRQQNERKVAEIGAKAAFRSIVGAEEQVYREAADKRVKNVKETNEKLKEAEEKLSKLRESTLTSSEDRITETFTRNVDRRLTELNRFNIEYQKHIDARENGQTERNIASDQYFNTLEGITQVHEDQRQQGEEYFRVMSYGYARLMDISGRFSQQAQDSLTQLGQGLGEGLSGEKGGFGKALLALYNFGVQSYSADFYSRLAAAGPGKASGIPREGQQGGSNFDQLAQSASTAQPEVQALDSMVARLSSTIQTIDPSSLQINTQSSVLNLQNMNSSVNRVKSSLNSLKSVNVSQPFSTGSSAASSFASSASSAAGAVASSSQSTATAVNRISSAFRDSSNEVRSFASTAVAELNKVTEAANAAAAAQARARSGGGGGGLLGAIFGGFRADGGPVNRGKGYVVGENGPEWFEPRTNGRIFNSQQIQSNIPRTSGSGSSMNVTVINNGNDSVETRQLSDTEMLVIIDKKVSQGIQKINNDILKPNSDISDSLNSAYRLRNR